MCISSVHLNGQGNIMKKFALLILLLISPLTFAINELVVKVPNVYNSRPGYIDHATLVVQPFGGYIEQSLYMEYSDHNQFSGYPQAEIIHRFELPQGSTVNDLWLWIGDSVMKAIVLDTWTARHIYDSIVSMKRDPAFLVKKGNQYELHIFPLTPGSFRKIKMNFITPVRSLQSNILAAMPLDLLKSSNNNVQSLKILFRTEQYADLVPAIKELPNAQFSDLLDTLDYHYKMYVINNIKSLNTLNLTYSLTSSQNAYFKSNENDNTQRYFQLMFNSKNLFSLPVDSSSKKLVFALDLSGNLDKSRLSLQEKLPQFLRASLKQNDEFNIVIAGAGKIKKVFSNYMPADSANITEAISSLFNSAFFDSTLMVTKKTLLFADGHARNNWDITGIDSIANVTTKYDLMDAQPYFSSSSTIASYCYGWTYTLDQSQLNQILASTDSLFYNGGRYLTYFDYNRDGREQIATHYIDGLQTLKQVHENVTLYRETEGNIGLDFPESVDHAGTYFLKYNDPGVRIELKNAAGEPTVISKRIGNGLIVVSGMWEFNDDAALKRILNAPLLGVGSSYEKRYRQLIELYIYLKSLHQESSFNKVVVVSNSDSLLSPSGASSWADNYLAQYGQNKPTFSSVNLLTGQSIVPPMTTYDGNVYYGSGLLMNFISQKSGGIHFESFNNDVITICSGLLPITIAPITPIQITAQADNSAQLITDFREIKLEPVIPDNPKMYIGATKGVSNISFDISARIIKNDSLITKNLVFPLSHDTTQRETIINSMIGNEKIKALLNVHPADTALIVALALKHNLLCDFSAMLALEPNDTIHFMHNPFDESPLLVEKTDRVDSVFCSVYPNPFNISTRIMVNLKNPSKVSIEIFNILGRLVQTLNRGEETPGLKTYNWNGRNSYGAVVSSGLYILRVCINDNSTHKQSFISKKLMLLK